MPFHLLSVNQLTSDIHQNPRNVIPPGPKHSIILIQNKRPLPRHWEIPAAPAGYDVTKEQMCHQQWLKHTVSFIRLVLNSSKIWFLAFPLSFYTAYLCAAWENVQMLSSNKTALFIHADPLRICPQCCVASLLGKCGEKRAWPGACKGIWPLLMRPVGDIRQKSLGSAELVNCPDPFRLLSLSAASKQRPTQERFCKASSCSLRLKLRL